MPDPVTRISAARIGFSRRFVLGEMLNEVEMKLVERSVLLWSERLASISWFMRRLNEPLAREANREDLCTGNQPDTLFPFAGNPLEPMQEVLPFQLNDYIELVDWTGRIIREDKRGVIPQNLPPILERLSLDPNRWLTLSTQFEHRFRNLVGVGEQLKRAANILGFKRRAGMANCRALLG